MSIRYTLCDRWFDSGQSLQQHLRDSPAHTLSFDCQTCNRRFGSQEALQQHMRDSPAHALVFNCEACNRSFKSQEALDQHSSNSPAHAPSFNCDNCARSFNSQEALDQHSRDSPAHTLIFKCETCHRSFNSQGALDQHLRDSDIHQEKGETPLDVFFRSFPTFRYDPGLPPATSYAQLRQHEGWHRKDTKSDQAWIRYQDALQGELRLWYGEEHDLTAWHALCRAIGIEPLPKTCEQCEEVVRRTHVNIVDLIEWGRSDRSERVQVFGDVAELRAYTKETNKVFHNTLDQDGGNIVLRHLLRYIFRGSL
ncbi:hypothetical protein QQZ08_004589 [Neonectria magnoliae]|uniref:C2H2-type domain-containing protein n=1 Tax=Neonectria magnoliae TaxID=2732573 RepID=A0ABR1I6H2_9HYPO